MICDRSVETDLQNLQFVRQGDVQKRQWFVLKISEKTLIMFLKKIYLKITKYKYRKFRLLYSFWFSTKYLENNFLKTSLVNLPWPNLPKPNLPKPNLPKPNLTYPNLTKL